MLGKRLECLGLTTLEPTSGTGKTIPFVCTDDAFTIGQVLTEGSRSTLESDTTERRAWERGRVDANICQRSGNGNETGEYVGTAFVARDIMRVAEALGEDGMLRYWGETRRPSLFLFHDLSDRR